LKEHEATASENAAALEIVVAVGASEDDLVETPEAFLTRVSTALKASDDVDVDLAAILSDHLLTVAPNANVIVNSKTAILALAAKRAAPGVKQADG